MPARKPVEELDSLGRLIRIARKKERLTQEALAALLGLKQTDVSAVERGDRGIRGPMLMSWARALNVDVTELANALEARANAAKNAPESSEEGSLVIDTSGLPTSKHVGEDDSTEWDGLASYV